MTDISEFLAWREDLGDDDLLQAFTALKTIEAIEFALVIHDAEGGDLSDRIRGILA